MNGPFVSEILFELGGIPVARSVATSVGITALLGLIAFATCRRLAISPGKGQALVELVVTGIDKQIADVMRRDPRPFWPLLGGLFIYLLVANLCSVIPGVSSPTAHLEAPIALAAIVFVAIRYYGIRASGLRGHLRSYTQPSIWALPLNIIGEITRTFALVIRLFGNIMSGQFLVAVVVTLAGLLVPIPLMALGLVVGAIQAYIFTVLAAVFIAAGIGSLETEESS